jgi:hypothetical protein
MMRRIVILPSIVFCATLVLVGLDQIAPRWTKKVGLDFWNVGNLAGRLKDEETTGKRLDYELELGLMRREELDRIALAVCEFRMTLDEAIELMIPITQSHPAWRNRLQVDRNLRSLSVSSERDLAAYYLWLNVHVMLDTANILGDETRAAAVAKRLAHLEIEIREQKGSPTPLSP